GGTYSLLDTQALIEYGEKAQDKPLSDAFLILNHKNAFEYLYDNLSINSIFEVHARLTDDHGLPALKDALHFLDKEHQGVAREYNDVTIAMSAYSPPFRPGTGYVPRMLDRILDISSSIEDPIQSAFYLLTRIPYLQPFADGNKRTSRAICNVPLIKARLPPISFVDFGKKDYIISLLAFYELGDIRMAAQCFSKAYLRSCERLGLKVLLDSKVLPDGQPHNGF
ncbi:MAG: Fic family protein, partial [Rhodocyclaceae bacterium]|nr:Fic family protein [Rhodocyclaceae bacterium]